MGTRGYFNYRWTNISAAYQIHKPVSLDGVEGLNYYFGGGASAYFWSYDVGFLDRDRYTSTSFGIQGYLGLDYVFEDLPINISLDWTPTVFLNGFGSGFGGGFGSLGIRYVFSR